MFHTFNFAAPAQRGPDQPGLDSDLLPRKRQKVSRACDRCRTFRIKCGEKPCSRCVIDKVRCVSSSGPSAEQKSKISISTREHSEPHARDRIRHDAYLENSKMPPTPVSVSGSIDNGLPLMPSTPTGSSPEIIDNNSRVRLDENNGYKRPSYVFAQIDAFFADPSTTSSTSTSTSASTTTAVLKTCYLGPFPNLPHTVPSAQNQQLSNDNEHLTEDQQTYFLRLFWEAYHPLLQASDESEFQSLFDLDWRQDSEDRKLTKALANCMTALGIQYGHGAGLASRILSLRRAVNISWIGYAYFRRCRDYMALLTELTLLSLRCYALMALYLMNASNFGEAYSLLGIAIRNGHSANLHQEPSECLQPKERMARRRIWWLLFMLDVKCSQQLGKPVAVQPSTIMCALPSINELATIPGNTRVCWKNLNVSTYFIHAVKLAASLAEINSLVSTSKLFEDASHITNLEQRASLLTSSLGCLEKWRNELPEDLLSLRKNAGYTESMSISESPIVLELGAPSWLHHQRVLLEVYYHNAYIMLQRPFICFPQAFNFSPTQQPQTDQHARSSLQHATAMTIIVHDVCSSSDVLFGWPEIMHPLWNATVTMLGFVLANPFCSQSPGAKQSVYKALAVFEAFATTEPFAARAKEMTQLLIGKLNSILVNSDEKLKQTSHSVITSRSILQHSSNTSLSQLSPSSVDVLTDPFPSGGGGLGPTFDDTLFADDSLCSWIGALEDNIWTGYQEHLDKWLGNPCDEVLDATNALEKAAH